MKEVRRQTITVTRRRRLRLTVSAVCAHCAVCAREVATLDAAHAAQILEVNQSTLDSLIAAGQVHTIATVSGSRRICQDSLFPKGVKDDLA